MQRFTQFFFSLFVIFSLFIVGCTKCKTCLNGGEYTQNACECPSGYTGDLCETPVNQSWFGSYNITAMADSLGNGCLEGITVAHLRADGNDPSKLRICFSNPYPDFAGIDICYCYVVLNGTADNGTIPLQLVQGHNITGSISRTGNSIKINLKLEDSGIVSCNTVIDANK